MSRWVPKGWRLREFGNVQLGIINPQTYMTQITQTPNFLIWLRQLSDLESARKRLNKKSGEFAETTLQIELLRGRLPTAILGYYDQRCARGKPGIARVRNGVCGGCHLSLPRGRAVELRGNSEVLSVCDNCGVFIFQDEEAPESVPAPIPVRRRYARRIPRECRL